MGLTKKVRIGKKNTIYLPKSIVEATGLGEGEEIMLKVEGEKITMEKLQDPLELALTGRKFASIRPEEIEEISLEEQEKMEPSS